MNTIPFPHTELGEGADGAIVYAAKWDDVQKYILSTFPTQNLYIDIRSAGYWFEKMDDFPWNREAPNAYMEDTEGCPWIVEWRDLGITEYHSSEPFSYLYGKREEKE